MRSTSSFFMAAQPNAGHEQFEQRLLRVQAVLRLVPDRRALAVEDARP